MLAVNTFVAFFAFAAPLLVRADVNPTGPAPGDTFNQGSNCVITWSGDTNSTTNWKNMAIELMTGDNINMVHLTTVATNQDGTVNGRFSYTCPQVTPNSAIYFYQFTNPQTLTATWTGRFTIAGPGGASTPPANAVQPGSGASIPWGTGALVNPAQAVPPPSFDVSVSGSSLTASLPLATANSSTLVPTAIGTVGASTGGLTTVVTSTLASSTGLATSTPSSTSTASGALGAMAGFDTRVFGAVVAVATLALSFVW